MTINCIRLWLLDSLILFYIRIQNGVGSSEESAALYFRGDAVISLRFKRSLLISIMRARYVRDKINYKVYIFRKARA